MERNTPQQPTPVIRRRRRPALSCRECRRRIVRCDHDEPCAHCRRHQIQCIYKRFNSEPEGHVVRNSSSLGGPSPRTPQPTAESPQSSLQDVAGPRLSPAQQATRAGTPIAVRRSPEDRPVVSALTAPAGKTTQHATFQGSISAGSDLPSAPMNRRPSCGEHTVAMGDLLSRIEKLEKSKASSSPAVEPSDRPSGLEEPAGSDSFAHRPPSGPQQGWQTVLDKSRDWGRSRWIGKAPEFATMIRCYGAVIDSRNNEKDDEAAMLIRQSRDLLQSCKSRAKRLKASRPTRNAPSPTTGLSPPSREMADEMVKLYFESFESMHRILHAPTFQTEYRKYWDHPEGATPDLRHKVLLVVGIGSSLHAYEDEPAAQSNIDLVHTWIYAAQTWLSGPLEKDRLGITGIQIYCLTVLARQIFSIGGDTVWISMGSLVYRAMQIGLHRDPKYLPPMSVLQAEIRRRLWATILELVVQSSLDAWMPPRVSVAEYDTAAPSNIHDSELDESTSTTVESPRAHPTHSITSSSFQLALLESLPTRLQIVDLLNGLHTELSYGRVLLLTQELSAALQRHGALFNPHNSTPFQRTYLDFLVRRFLIPLHYPFSHQAGTNPLFQASTKLSLETALLLISPESDDAFARLISLGGGLFREGIRCASTAITLELLAHTETRRREGSLRRAGQYRDFLVEAVRKLAALAERRIRSGETNVKSYMFMRMVLAQVQAVEQDVDVDVEVCRAMRDSLAFCEGLLRERAAAGREKEFSAVLVGGAGEELLATTGTTSLDQEFGGFQPPDGDDFDWDGFFFTNE